MSWNQGVTPREDLPASFLEWADGQGKGALEYITWWDDSEVILDYGKSGHLVATVK